ncbi:MAG: hypothetical protein AVDCRST_MAG85-4211 [uncultured Solirubrobacteraceae bacterium]|uniref:Uncharacterized protein n=1 Tax=uncultured Solirubrobacteraceae bacterium TaxID=1162706 RepID=A0A6J4U1B7_9ACTN|nr:MAG: hypothetical protein AVDCRST_MAG85-4211 [uncultured Solirubrobacteraceae bacterium]
MRALLIAVALLCLAAPAASAESRVLVTEARSAVDPLDSTLAAGPRIVGDEVLWAEHRSATDEIAVVADGPAGRRTVDRLPNRPARVFRFDAAEGRVALASFLERCPPPGCDRSGTVLPTEGRLGVGPVSGPLADVPIGCTTLVPEVAADAVGANCFGEEFRVREDDGTVRTLDGRQPWFEMQLAGPYLARALGEQTAGTGVIVENRRTGEQVFRVDAPLRGFHLAPDGSVALALTDRRVGLASPSAPGLRTIAVPFEPEEVRLAGDRVAARAGRAPRFVVLDTAGSVLGAHAPATAFRDWAFDGRRVAWLQRPCSVVTLAVWEVADAPPESAGERCGAPTVRPARVVSRARRFAISLRCPEREAAGCAGSGSVTLTGTTRGGSRFRRVHGVLFDLDPGAATTVRGRVSATDVRRLRRLRRLRAEILLEPQGAGGGSVVRRAIRLPRR